MEDPLLLTKDLRIHPQPKILPTGRSALRHEGKAINLYLRIISKRVGDDRRIQGEIIKAAKNNWLHYSSGMKYAILFTSIQGIKAAKIIEPI